MLKKSTILVVLAATLVGCGPVTTDEEDAAMTCRGIANSDIRDNCMANYLNNVQANRNAQWDMIGTSMLSRPVHTSCMNSGGIVTCDSR